MKVIVEAWQFKHAHIVFALGQANVCSPSGVL